MSTDFEIYAGDTKRVRIDVVDDAGDPLDLTTADLTWVLAPWAGGSSILTKTDVDGIAISVPAGGSVSSRMTVTIDAGDVTDPGDYYHAARVEISGVVDTVRAGTVRVLDSS